MGAERRLLAAAALLTLVSVGALAAPPADAAPTAGTDRLPVTPAQTSPVSAKTVRDAPAARTGSGNGTETATGPPPTSGGDTQSKIYDGSSCECT